MREIKFRAWYKDIKKMAEWEDLENLVYETESLSSVFDNDVLELMQFTGLLDKNGKEIYEGDIVQYHNISHGTRTTVVSYNEGYCEFHPMNSGAEEMGVDRKSIEVIGNIYQNKDLLK